MKICKSKAIILLKIFSTPNCSLQLHSAMVDKYFSLKQRSIVSVKIFLLNCQYWGLKRPDLQSLAVSSKFSCEIPNSIISTFSFSPFYCRQQKGIEVNFMDLTAMGKFVCTLENGNMSRWKKQQTLHPAFEDQSLQFWSKDFDLQEFQSVYSAKSILHMMREII